MTVVTLVSTGLANTASVRAAFERLGARTLETRDPEVVREAERLVLPGVGAFGAGMATLRAAGLVEPLRARISDGRPTLGICLGFQFLCEGSEESPGVEGLGLLPGTVRTLRGPHVPQLGWNRVAPDAECRFVDADAFYFAHGFALADAPPGWRVARTGYGEPFVAAAERGAVLACQFHPELSGAAGEALLRRWLDQSPRPAPHAVSPPPPTDGSYRRIVPCLDVRDGRVVKGVQFANLRDAGDPAALAAAYAASGADELVVLDVSATPEGRATAARTVEAVRAAIDIPLTVGGGVRRVEDAARLLAAGADKVAVNTAAVRDPSLLDALAERFGRQCVVLSLDAAREGDVWRVVVHSGKERTPRTATGWASEATQRGAGEILLTSWDRDGTRDGYDTALVRAVSEVTRVPVIASGGAGAPGDLARAFDAGADAVLAASIFHDGDYDVARLKAELEDQNPTRNWRIRR